MKTEFLTSLGLEKDIIDKIMAENGKDIEAEKVKTSAALNEVEKLKEEKQTLTDKVSELSNSEVSAKEYKDELEKLKAEIKSKEEKERLETEEKQLTDSILDVIKNKTFSSNYAKEGVIRDMKAEIAKPENKSRNYAEIFETLTKDKEGIFANPNPPAPMPGMGKVDTKIIADADARAVMGLPPLKD